MKTALASIFICTAMIGCKTVRVSESDFLRPDLRPEAFLRPGQTLDRFTIETPHGEIAATRITKPGNTTVILYCGGNQFRKDTLGGSISAAFPASVDLVMFDYPGYGESTGSPTLVNLMESATAVYDQLLTNPTSDYRRHAVYGASMGGFVAAHVAAERSPELLILEGTAASASQMMKSLVPWFAKPFIFIDIAPSLARYDNVTRLRDFQGNTLLLAGSTDSQTKPAIMRQLNDGLHRNGVAVQFRTIEGRGHGDVLGSLQAQEAISSFLEANP